MQIIGWIMVVAGLIAIIYFVIRDDTCPACNGTGEMFDEEYKNGCGHDCPHCRGQGRL